MFGRFFFIFDLTNTKSNSNPRRCVSLYLHLQVHRLMKFGQIGVSESSDQFLRFADDAKGAIEDVLMTLLEVQNGSYVGLCHEGRF